MHAFKLNIGLFRRLSLLLVLIMLTIGLCPAAYALTPLDPYAGAELSVVFAYNGTPLPGARFSLYRVGDVDADARITLIPPFSEKFTVTDARTASQWDQIAANMAKFCRDNKIEPLSGGTTDQSGRVRFGNGRSLACGLYLVVGEDLIYQNAKYISSPFLLLLPTWNTESKVWEYTVRAAPKLEREALPPQPTITPTPTPGVTPTPGPHVSPTPAPVYPSNTNSGTAYPKTLPQTGLLWWPVPPMLLCGVGLTAAGLIRRRQNAGKSGYKGRLPLCVGLCAMAFALTLFMHNMWADARAGIRASEEKEALIAAVLPEKLEWTTFANPELSEAAREQSRERPGADVGENKAKPYINMPVKVIDGVNYVAMLSIPNLDLELPIRAAWDMEGLKYSPARFSGSAYMSDLVICAHNFSQHFGRLKDLEEGSEILLVDMEGNLFRYQVEKIETLQPEDVEEMVHSEYELSLFTCTLGGATRVTVRCRQTGVQTKGFGDLRVKS